MKVKLFDKKELSDYFVFNWQSTLSFILIMCAASAVCLFLQKMTTSDVHVPMIFSSGTMAQKLGSAVSGSLIALILGLAGAHMIQDDFGNTIIDPASVTESVKTMVWALFSLIPAAIAIVMGWLAYKFPLKK